MPYTLHLDLRLDRPAPKAALNVGLHGLVFELLAKHDQNLANALHGQVGTSQSARQFSIAALVQQDNRISWRLHLLNEAIIGQVQQAFAEGTSFGQGHLQGQVVGQETSGQLYSEIYQKHQQKPVPSTISLRFLSCTILSYQGKSCLAPQATAILTGLAKLWRDHYSHDANFAREVGTWSEQHVKVLANQSSWASMYIGNKKRQGFVGSSSFTVAGPPELCRYAAILADLARYTGVGVSTGYGLGESKLERVEY
jgi:CRISPR/Cas system endoribonuclease Cas6 (RAMP superfamily)